MQPVTVRRPMRRRLTRAMAVGAVALMPMGCAWQGYTLPAVSALTLRGEGTLAEPARTANAFEPQTTTEGYTRNPALAPVGARLAATMTPSGTSTNVEFTVSGLVPNRGYSVHAHTNACSAIPDSEGPHYQNRIDPAATAQAPSRNPEYANPNNEIWLDLRTDAAGSGTSRVTVPFVFTDRGPGSIVVHEAAQTATGPGQAGEAGARLACLTLSAVAPEPFSPLG